MCSILIVEDEIDLLEMISHEVSQLPFVTNIQVSSTLQNSLALLRKYSFDLILLDLNLPDSEGADTVESIIVEFPESVILVMTGIPLDRPLLDRLCIAGAFSILNKVQLFQSLLSDWISRAWSHKKALVLLGPRT